MLTNRRNMMDNENVKSEEEQQREAGYKAGKKAGFEAGVRAARSFAATPPFGDSKNFQKDK